MLYCHHIWTEDTEVFRFAGRMLPSMDLEAIGRETSARRGIGGTMIPFGETATHRLVIGHLQPHERRGTVRHRIRRVCFELARAADQPRCERCARQPADCTECLG